MPLMRTFRVPTMANWLRYRGPGYYVLFALWVTGIIDAILNLTAPSQRHALFFGRAGVLFIPVGVLTVFSFILWLIWNKIEKPSLINRASEPPGRVADAGGAI
jgi:hypothetical protein